MKTKEKYANESKSVKTSDTCRKTDGWTKADCNVPCEWRGKRRGPVGGADWNIFFLCTKQ